MKTPKKQCTILLTGVSLYLVALLGGCARSEEPWIAPDTVSLPVRIEPFLTRVVGTTFEVGDAIGLRIKNSEGTYVENRTLTYDGSYFSASEFIWYNDITLQADLVAYYPYVAGAELPSSHSVAADQQSATAIEASDLLAATLKGVTPTAEPVEMTFHHLMSKLSIELDNQSDGEVTALTLGGACLKADLQLESGVAMVNAAAVATDITPRTLTAGSRYEAIVVPQQASLVLKVATDDGKLHTHNLVATDLLAGKIYTISVTLNNIELTASLRSEIEDWTSGGVIDEQGEASLGTVEDGSDTGSNNAASGDTLSYGGVNYAIATLADGRCWMVENLRYGTTATEGIYHPLKESGSEADVTSYGLLYTAAVALGVDSITADNCASLEGAQGICPAGWHIPTESEVTALKTACSSVAPENFRFTTPYYWSSTTSAYVAPTNRGLFLTSTYTPNYSGSRMQAAVIYADDNSLSTTAVQATFAHPVRCIRNQ